MNSCCHLPLTITVTLLEILVSSKPIIATEQVYCPPSPLSIGENVTVLVYATPLLVRLDIVTRGEEDNELGPVQLTVTRSDCTPLTTVNVQARTCFSPLTLSTDCGMTICG